MDVGLSHALTIDGASIGANWVTFNPKLITGKEHKIMFFDKVLKLEEVFKVIKTPILTTSKFDGEFISSGYSGDVEIFKSNYQVKVKPNAPVEIRTFVYLSDGVPWAMCTLDKTTTIKQNVDTVFLFSSTLKVMNNKELTKNTIISKDDNYEIKYSASIAALKNRISRLTTSQAIGVTSTNKEITDVLENGDPIANNLKNITANVDDGLLSISMKSTAINTLDNIKAVYINLFWNVGIVLYFEKSSNYQSKNHNGLSVCFGDEVNLGFEINFKEV